MTAGFCRGSHQPTSKSRQPAPPASRPVATHDRRSRQCCLGFTFTNSSCGGARYPGDASPYHPSPLQADSGTDGAPYFSRSPHPYSWPWCWSPQYPSIQRHGHLWPGSSSLVASPIKPTPGPRPEWPPPATGLSSKALGAKSPAPPLPFPQLPTSRFHGQQPAEAAPFFNIKTAKTSKRQFRGSPSLLLKPHENLPDTP